MDQNPIPAEPETENNRNNHESISFFSRNKQGEKKNLFEFVEDSISVSEIPVEQELIDDSEIIASLGESREELLYVALGLLLDKPSEPGEEPGLARPAFEPGKFGSGRGYKEAVVLRW